LNVISQDFLEVESVSATSLPLADKIHG